MGSRLYCMRWLVIQANLILMVSQLYTTLNIALSLSYLPISSGLRSCSLSTRHLDDDRQVVLGGVAEEPLVHGHHLHYPHLLYRHDPPLLFRMLRRHEGDQVLPAHVRDPIIIIHFHVIERTSLVIPSLLSYNVLMLLLLVVLMVGGTLAYIFREQVMIRKPRINLMSSNL